jgi:hypothetical protein
MDLALSSLPELITHFLAEWFGLILALKSKEVANSVFFEYGYSQDKN